MKKINEIELASNLAHKAVVGELVVNTTKYEDEDDLLTFDNDDETFVYKDDVQDCFNRWYDFYLEMIEETEEK